MRAALLISPFVCVASTVWAAPQMPTDIAGKTVVVLLNSAEMCRSDLHAKATGPWYSPGLGIPLLLSFPAGSNGSYTVSHPHNSGETTWPDIKVDYSVGEGGKAAYVKLGNSDFQALVELTCDNQSAAPQGKATETRGKAYIYWHEDGETRHIRGASFILRDARQNDPAIQLPGQEPDDVEPTLQDDGLSDLLAGLDKRVTKTADDRLYVRRLKTILPLVLAEQNPNYTSAEYKGNTALHYACGLSHVELVQWLVNHGADTAARTNRGKTPADCVSGLNAAAIRKILKQGPRAVPSAPLSAVGKTFTFTGTGDGPISVSWRHTDVEDSGKVTPGEDWQLTHVEYVRTGAATATVLRRTEWSPGGTYATGWRDMVFELKFNSPTGGTATCTEQDKKGAFINIEGTFTLK